MRLAMILEQPDNNASSYWRAIQFVPMLAERGVAVDVMATKLPERPTPPFARERQKINLIRGFLRRTSEIQGRIRDCDAVFVQRGAYPMGPAHPVKSLANFRGRVLFDLDDNVFERPPWLAHSMVKRWLYSGAQARYLLGRADHVFVSSAALAGAITADCPVDVWPTVPDVRTFPQAKHEWRSPTRVCWTGNPGNLLYLDPLKTALERLREEAVAELTVVSSEAWSGPSRFERWSRHGEAAWLAENDIGIMPLVDTPYTRAKAGFKLLMYMGAGLAVVASPVGVNRQLVEDSGAGLLAESAPEWEHALRVLASDVERRRAMGTAGRLFVSNYADVNAHADAIVRAIGG
jgi:hypothetical protein